MAITDSQKLDALYKKFGFGVTKTDTATNKSPSNEAVPSPLLVRGDRIWNESDLIPATPPTTSSDKVKVRKFSGDGRVAATADATVVPSSRTWKTGVTDWIPPQFGASYSVKVYADTVGAVNPESTGTLLAPDGSNSDAYIFDYASGVLNFADTNLPAALTGKAIFVVGYTYQGSIGIKNSSQLGGGLASSNGSITTTVTNGDLTLAGNGTGNIVLNDTTVVNGTLTATDTITAPSFVGDITSTGTSSFKDVTISGTAGISTLNVSGNTALHNTSVAGTLNVTGATTLSTLTAADTTLDNLVVKGTSDLKGATTVGTVATNADLMVYGNITTSGNETVGGNLVVTGDLTVKGTQTIVETEILKVADNIITLNSGIGAVAPTENAGLEIDRGSDGVMTLIRWNETSDKVEVQQGGSLVEVATVNNVATAKNALQSELDATQAAAGLKADGSLEAFTGANYVSTASTLKAAIATLDSDLFRVESGVGVWGNLTTTAKTVVAAINELDAEISDTTLTTGATTVKAAINEVDLHANNLYTVLGVTDDATQTGFDGLNYITTNSTVKAAIVSLDSQLKTTTNQVDGKIGTLTGLSTTAQGTLVSSINEVDSHANNLYSSLGSFATQDANALVISGTNYLDTATTVSLALSALDTQLKTTTSQVDGNIGTLSNLTTTTSNTLVGAINEVDLHANNIYTVLGVTADANQSGLSGLNYVADNSTLTTAISSLDSQLKTTTQQVDGVIGNLNALTTTAKNTLVAAINEVDLHANKLYTTLGSFSTQDADTLVIAGTNYLDSATTVSLALAALDTQLKTTTSQVDGNIGVLSTLTTGSKGTLVGAINEVDAHANNLYSVVGSFATQDANALVITGTNYLNTVTTISGAISALDTQLKTTTNQVDGVIGDLHTLTTTAKNTLVAAINELDGQVGELTSLTNMFPSGYPSLSNSTIVDAINSLYYYDSSLQEVLGSAVYIGEGNGLQFTDTNYINTVGSTITTVTDTFKLLDTELHRVETGIGAWGSLTTTAKTVVTAINELDTDLAAEVTRATTVEGNLASLTTASKANLVSAINSEVARATNAESGVTTRLNNINIAAGFTADTYTADASTNYLATATSLTNADKLLDTKLKATIVDLADTTAGKGTALVGYKGYVEADSNIVSPTVEITAGTVQAALDDIAQSVNIKIHELESRYVKAEVSTSEKSDVYTLVHNLDTSFIDVSVQVYDDVEHVWRFDLVVVEVVDDNTVTVSLAAGIAQQIRYVIHGY